MLGIKHRLFVREETVYGDTYTADATDANDIHNFKDYYVYSNVGSRPSKTISQVSGSTLNRVAKAPTLGRQSVTGGFSFYLPVKNFGIFYKNLLGSYSTTTGTAPLWTTYSTSPLQGNGLGFISRFDSQSMFVYDGMITNSATISCGDSNSLVEISLDFIGQDLRRVTPLAGAGDLDLHYFTATDENTVNIQEVALSLNETVMDFYPAWRTQLTPTGSTTGETASLPNYATLFNKFRNLTLTISNNLGYDGRIRGGNPTDATASGFFAGLMGHRRNSPIPTGQRSITGSFEIPYPDSSNTASELHDLAQSAHQATGQSLVITFNTATVDDNTATTITLPEVHYDVPDFTALTNETTTLTINFTAGIECLTNTAAGTSASERSEITIIHDAVNDGI